MCGRAPCSGELHGVRRDTVGRRSSGEWRRHQDGMDCFVDLLGGMATKRVGINTFEDPGLGEVVPDEGIS